MREAFDLSELKLKISGVNSFKEVMKAIKRYESVCSHKLDIVYAQRSIAALRNAFGEEESQDRYGQALMMHAVMMYCRSALEDGVGRYGIGVTKNYSRDLLKKHQSVVELRHQTLAHFGTGVGVYGSGWTDERVVLRITGPGSEDIVQVFNRVNYLGLLVLDLEVLCDAALARIEEVMGQRLNQLHEQMLAAFRSSSRFAEEVKSCKFSADAFFKAEDAREQFWNGVTSTEHAIRETRMTDGVIDVPLGDLQVKRIT